MQPALAEVVQNLTVPLSAATAIAFRGARMSMPWWGPPARGWPKSSSYVTGPTTGNTIGAAAGGAAAAGAVNAPMAAASRSPRAVVRWRLIGLRFALEGRHPTPDSGRSRAGSRVL